jgi:hypothetical protein
MLVKNKNFFVVIGLVITAILFLLYFLFYKKEVDDSRIRYELYSLENVGWKSKKYSQKVDDISFTAIEVPIQYYILKNQGKQDLFKIDSIYQENKNERVYEFLFEQDAKKDLLDKDFTNLGYKDAISYLSFKIENDFYLVTESNDTIPTSGVLYERNFKVAPYQKVMVFFSGIAPKEKVQLVYKDILFRKGVLKFKLKEPLKKIAQ